MLNVKVNISATKVQKWGEYDEIHSCLAKSPRLGIDVNVMPSDNRPGLLLLYHQLSVIRSDGS